MSEKASILYCRCAYAQVIPDETKDGVLDRLCESGRAFDSVSDLCEMSARRDARLAAIASGEQPLRIAACHQRAVRWLFDAAGAPLPEDAEIINMRDESAADASEKLLA